MAVLLRRRDRVVVVAVVVLQLLVHQLLHLLHRVYQLQALLVVDLVMLTGMVGRQVVLVRVVLVQGRRGPEGNCIKIGLLGKLILSKRKGLREVTFS